MDFHCIPLTIDKNHLIATDFYRFRFLSIDHTWNCTDVVFGWAADLITREKLGAYKPGQNKPSEEDFKLGFKEKIRFLRVF